MHTQHIQAHRTAVAGAMLALLIGAGDAVANALDDGDIGLFIGEDDRLLTGLVRDGQIASENVFTGRFDDAFTSNPGYDSSPGTFNSSSRLGLNSLATLRLWEGPDDGFRNLDPDEEETVTFIYGPVFDQQRVTTREGFGFENDETITVSVDSNGEYHRHIGMRLDEPAREGVYLLELEKYSNDASLAHTHRAEQGEYGASDPFWVLLSENAHDQLEAAEQYVREHVAGPGVLVGDMNLDGAVNTADVAPFVLALTDRDAYIDQFGVDPTPMGDINGDGAFNTADVAPFVQMLVGGDAAAAAVPEPGTLTLAALGGVLLLSRRRRCGRPEAHGCEVSMHRCRGLGESSRQGHDPASPFVAFAFAKTTAPGDNPVARPVTHVLVLRSVLPAPLEGENHEIRPHRHRCFGCDIPHHIRRVRGRGVQPQPHRAGGARRPDRHRLVLDAWCRAA